MSLTTAFTILHNNLVVPLTSFPTTVLLTLLWPYWFLLLFSMSYTVLLQDLGTCNAICLEAFP